MFQANRCVVIAKYAEVKHFQNPHGKQFHKQYIDKECVDIEYALGNSTPLVLENG